MRSLFYILGISLTLFFTSPVSITGAVDGAYSAYRADGRQYAMLDITGADPATYRYILIIGSDQEYEWRKQPIIEAPMLTEDPIPEEPDGPPLEPSDGSALLDAVQPCYDEKSEVNAGVGSRAAVKSTLRYLSLPTTVEAYESLGVETYHDVLTEQFNEATEGDECWDDFRVWLFTPDDVSTVSDWGEWIGEAAELF